MNATYLLGVLAAIGAGVAFNLGMVIQKVAVRRATPQMGLMRQVVRDPRWLAGFALQFLVGMPLNLLALSAVGPALLPGLMASGLIVLAIGAVWLAGETLDLDAIAGICLVVTAVTLLGFSRLEVDVEAIDLGDGGFLARLVTFTAIVAALSLTCHLLQGRMIGFRGVLRTLDAGLLLAQVNLWLAIVVALVARWGAGRFTGWDLLPMGVASAICFAGSMLGILETQRAFQVGDAARLVPIQSVPQQILPLLSYLTVFRLPPPDPAALLLAALGATLILAGSAFLARHQALANQPWSTV